MSKQATALVLGAILSTLLLAACSLDIPDLNNPGIDQLKVNPTAAGVNSAAVGLLIGDRAAKATTGGLVCQLGILGREAYDIDTAEGRPVTELLLGDLNKASPFGGAFWGGQYANIRLANIILHAVDKVAAFTEAQKSAIRGFTHTIMALELITVILTHDDTGAVIDTDHDLGEPLGPFVPKAQVYAEINRLLDQAQSELMMAYDGVADPTTVTFPFSLGTGYRNFDRPVTFLTFNRAIRAKIAVYLKDYQNALTYLGQSFLVDDASKTGFSLNTGVFHVYSTSAGDATNGLINPVIVAHPKLETEAQLQSDGKPDARYTAKVAKIKNPMTGAIVTVTAQQDSVVKSDIGFQIYTSSASSVPVIRNEELILLKAEALWFTGDQTGAVNELNFVRTRAGGSKLTPLDPAMITTDTTFIDKLLYERRYSLMFEGGHRWIDLRRFGIPLPLDDEQKHKRNVRYPVPQAECDARPGEPACMITSSAPATP
jgi:hypothetical protein